MVASTDIKFYVHTNTNAPQLTNNYGCMIDVLDACLVNGFGSQAVSSITAAGTTATVTFGSAHNYMQYQVIRIAGAVQTEYNGQHRILSVPSATTLTFELAAAPSASPATGTMTCDLPPLGWEKPFGNTGGKAAYRSTNLLLPSRPFLRVVDELDPAYTATYAKYAKVGIVEDMTDIDTMLGVQAPFDAASPNKNWVGTGSGTAAINGWAKWYYARGSAFNTGGADSIAPTASNRNWALVGNADWFIFMPSMITANSYSAIYGFGKFDSLLQTDSANNFLSATLDYIEASATPAKSNKTPLTSASSGSVLLIQRNYSQSAQYATASTVSLAASNTLHSGASNYIAAPATQGNIPLAPVCILEGNILRGSLPQVLWLFQIQPYTDMQVFVEGNRVYLAKYTAYASNTGQVAIALGEL